ncbi:unnamed protein product [Closterium sp. NIES-53]
MATPRVLRFDAEDRPLEFSVWLLRARRLLESLVQAHETLWAHASGDLPEPADPAPLAADLTSADSDRYAHERADVKAWKSRDAAACIVLSTLLPESEETHFSEVRTACEFVSAIKARYATPTTVSLGRLFLPFLFPDLASFERTADLIIHLRSFNSSYRAACTDAQLALPPPPMAITIYFIATSLPDRLASVRDALLLKHPSELSIEVLESALKDIESNLRSVASASGVAGGAVRVRAEAAEAVGVTWRAAAARVQGLEERLVQRPVTPLLQLVEVMPGFVSCRGWSSGVVPDSATAAAATAPPLAAATAAAAAAAGFGAGVRTSSAAARCRPPSLHLSRSDRCLPRPALWPQPPTGLGASLAEVPVASVGTCVDTSLGATPEDDLLSFTLDSGALHCFFHDRTTLTPLPTPVSVAVADPTSGPVTASIYSAFVPNCSLQFSNRLPRPLVLEELGGCEAARQQQQQQQQQQHLLPPTPITVPCQVSASHQVAASPQVAVFGQVPVSGPVAASCSCQLLAHPTVLWHHQMGHPSISRLHAMSSQRLVLGLPRFLPSLRPSLAPPCGPYVEGRLRATPHSSSLRPATEPFETLHLDVWGPASRPGPERESFFLVVVDDHSRYTAVFPLAKKSDVTSTLIRWLLTTADTRGLVMEIAHTSMTHTHAPHFRRPYTVRYAAHQLNLWPCVSPPEVSPTSLWTGSPGAASRFRVWGCLALVRDTSADKISPRAVPCVFLGFPKDSSDYTFYHPPLHRFFDSRDVRFVESVPYYVRYPCRGLPPIADPAGAGSRGEDRGGASSRGAGVGAESIPVRGPGSRGAGFGVEPVTAGDSSLWGAGVSGAVPGGATTWGAPSAGPGEPGMDPITSGGAGSGGGATARGERDGAAAAGATVARGAATAAAAATAAGAGAAAAAAATAGGASVASATGAAVAATSSSCLWYSDPRSPLSFSSLPPFSSHLRSSASSSPAVFPPPLPPLSPPLSHTWPSCRSPRARPSSPVPLTDLRTTLFRSSLPRSSPSVLPSPPESALTAPLSTFVTDYYRTYRPVLSRVLASLVSETRASLSSVSALTTVVTEFASARCLDYATSLVAAPPTTPLAVEGESALGCDALEDMDFELEFLAAASPHLCAMLLAPEGDPDALDIPTPRTYAEVVSEPWASQWRAAMDSEMVSYRSTSTYVDEVPPHGTNVVDGMWIFRVKQPPGSPPVFKARYVARGFNQREGVDFFQTFAPTPKMTTLRVLLHVAAQKDYELHSLDFSTVFLQGSLHEEVWLHRPLAFTGTFPPGTQWRLRRPVYDLRRAPCEWHDTLRSTLFYLGFQPSSSDPSLFVHRGSTPFFVLVYVDDLVFATTDRVALADVKLDLQKRHTCTDLGELRHYLGLQITRDRAARTITLSQSHMVQQVLQRFELQHSSVQRTPLAVDHRLTGPFPDEPFGPSGPYAELVGYLMYLMTCTRPDLAFPLSILARLVAPRRHRPVHWAAAVRVAKYLVTTSGVGLVLGGRQDVVLTGHYDSSYADDAETHRSTQGERPSSAPTLFSDNKVTILLCQEPRLESRVKHINVRYFLLRELPRHGQARFDFVESEANTADIFTKAMPPSDHQRCCVELGLVDTGSHLA